MDEYIIRCPEKAYVEGLDQRMPKIEALWEKVSQDSDYYRISRSLGNICSYAITLTLDLKKKMKHLKDMSTIRQHSHINYMIKHKLKSAKRLKDLSLILNYELRPHDLSLHYHGIMRDTNPSNVDYFIKWYKRNIGFVKYFQCYDRNETYSVNRWREYMEKDQLKNNVLPIVYHS